MLKLVLLKENAETPTVGAKIRGLLRPVEYTRLDSLADVMFDTVAEVDSPAAYSEQDEPSDTSSNLQAAQKSTWQFTDSNELQTKRLAVVAALGKRHNIELKRQSRALYASADGTTRVACGMSKRYGGKTPNLYWYAFHPQWDEFLSSGSHSYFVLGCMDKSEAYAIDHSTMLALLPFLNTTTTKEGSTYWHVHLREDGSKTLLVVPKRDPLDLTPFAYSL